MAVEQILEISTVRRTVASASPDPADRAAFELVAGVAALEILGARELWLKGTYSAAGSAVDTSTLLLYYYDQSGGFIGPGEPLVLAAMDRTDGGRFMTKLQLDINPGAYACRLHVSSITTAGDLNLHLGIVP